MYDLGKWILIIGCVIAAIGGLIWIGSIIGIPFGSFPGDIRISREKFSFYFPVVTSIVVSIVLTILLNIIFMFFKK